MVAAKLMRAMVARGRTVYAPDPSKRQIVGRGDDGRPMEMAVIVEHGPGSELELPADEVMSLRASGFLIDPGTPEVPRSEGPTFGREEQPRRIDAGE